MPKITKTKAYPPVEVVPHELPGKPLSRRSVFPKSSYIYFAITEDGTIQYIGKTIGLRSRWSSHHRLYELEQMGNVTIHYWKCGIRSLSFYEQTFIKQFKPPLNRKPINRPHEVTPAKRRKRPAPRLKVQPDPFVDSPPPYESETMQWCCSHELFFRLEAYAEAEGKSISRLYKALFKDCRQEKVEIQKIKNQFVITSAMSGQTILVL